MQQRSSLRFRMFRAMLGMGVALVCWGGSCRQADTETYVLLKKPIVVTACFPETTQGAALITVDYGDQQWSVTSSLLSQGSPDVLARLQERVDYRQGYLLIDEITGGNACRANLKHVLMIRQDKLHYLGNLSSLGGLDEQGLFRDIYDRYEMACASHNLGPRFEVVMTEKSGHWVVDRQRTWSAAQEVYQDYLKRLQSFVEHKEDLQSPNNQDRSYAFGLFCLVLTRYCDQADPYDRCLDLIRQVRGDVGDLETVVSTVIPGELPWKIES